MFAQEEPRDQGGITLPSESGDAVAAEKRVAAEATDSASAPDEQERSGEQERERVPLGSPPSGFEWGFV